LEPALLFLILYGVGGKKLGLTYLFWNESAVVQCIAGVAIGLLLAEITFVGFLLDADEDWFAELFGKKAQDAGLISLWPMYVTMLAFFWILLIPSAFVVKTKALYFHPGLLIGFGLFAGWILIAWSRFVKIFIPLARYFFVKLKKRIPTDAELPLHALAMTFFVGFLILYFVLVVLAPYLQGFPPAAAICTLFGLITAVYGAIRFHLEERRLVVFVSLVGLWILLVNLQQYRNPIPELKYEKESIQPLAHYPTVMRNQSGLLNNQVVLNEWLRLHQQAGPNYPPLVFVCAGGGGIRAALWTAVVLKTLEENKALQNFPYYIRIVTGASGGMLGASYYVSTLNPPGSIQQHTVSLQNMIENLAKDSLSDVARTLVLRDVLPFFGFARFDRGVALQRAWGKNTDGVLDIPFRKLAAGEQAGWRPSLVLSPMIVDDGRLLLISNLDLEDITVNRGSELSPEVPGIASRQAYEFYRMFRDSPLLLSTAIRLNASFPYVSPSAQLPTNPPLRLVDAGYFDNYGVNLTTEWLFSNLNRPDSIHNRVSGILLIQIRHQLDKIQPSKKLSWWRRGLSGFSSPVEGALQARESILSFRNDEDLEHLSLVLNRGVSATGQKFFTTVVFELQENVSLNWILTEMEKKGIQNGMNHKNNLDALRSVVDWWKFYGPSNTPPEREDAAAKSVLQESLD